MPRRRKSQPRVVSLYSGAGGMDFGFGQAGFELVWANDIDSYAVETHNANFGDHAVCGPIEDQQWPEPRSADVVIGGPPCFAAGTMVLTKGGYREIETLAVGTMVLTHKGRWRAVTKIMRRQAESTRLLRAQGCTPIITTDEHPFYARTRTLRFDSALKRYVRVFGEPEWVRAKEMLLVKVPERVTQQTSPFLAQVLPRVVANQRSEDEWWLIGRWLADGWLRRGEQKKRRTVILCCSYAEGDDLEEVLLGLYPKNRFTRTKERTATKFHIRDHQLYEFLLDFGRGASEKVIPGNLMSLDQSSARALLEGYYSGDGYFRQNGPNLDRKATTVSKALALSIALLAQRAYGMIASVAKVEVPATAIIEGRTVNQRTQYHVTIPPHNRSAFVEGKYGWKLLRKNEVSGPAEVWNIAVAEDESYMADGCIVHNCQGYSVIGKMDPTDSRSEHVFHFFDVVEALQPVAFVLENVKALAVNPRWEPIRQMLRERATELGYEHELFLLNAADYGVPQARERMFLVGIRGAKPRRPEPTVERHMTVREALAELPPYGQPGNDSLCTARIVPAKNPILRPDPYGGNLLFNGNGRVLKLDAPALTLPASMSGNATPIIDQKELDEGAAPWIISYHKRLLKGGSPMPVPKRLRRLTVEEAAALQTFPQDFQFVGKQSSKYRQIGNAVPPRLAYAVAREVKAVLDEHKLVPQE